MDKLLQNGKVIIRRLKNAGYEAYFVGGYVRDRLLNITTSDIDITTSASIDDIKALFDKVILTGEKYGTVTVLYEDHSFEVTTYRKDGPYSDKRHPDKVTYTKNLIDDLSRRDFTINQLVMDENEKITDHFNGLDDLKNGIIKTINDPIERFNEDALRLLRAFRFIAKLDFNLEVRTAQAIKQCAPLIKEVAIERIQVELDTLINYPYKRKAFKKMIETEFSQHLFDLHDGINVLSQSTIDYKKIHAYTVFYLETNDLFKRFRLSKKRMRAIEQLARIVYQTEEEPFKPEIVFHEGLEACLNANVVHQIYGQNDRAYAIKKIAQDLPIKSVCELKYKGEDILKQSKLKKQRHIGYIIDQLILDVIYHRIPNTKEALKAQTETLIENLEKSDIQ